MLETVAGSAVVKSAGCRLHLFYAEWKLSSFVGREFLGYFQTGLRIYCADRENVIQAYKNPIAEGNFQWIFARYWSQSEQ